MLTLGLACECECGVADVFLAVMLIGREMDDARVGIGTHLHTKSAVQRIKNASAFYQLFRRAIFLFSAISVYWFEIRVRKIYH